MGVEKKSDAASIVSKKNKSKQRSTYQCYSNCYGGHGLIPLMRIPYSYQTFLRAREFVQMSSSRPSSCSPCHYGHNFSCFRCNSLKSPSSGGDCTLDVSERHCCGGRCRSQQPDGKLCSHQCTSSQGLDLQQKCIANHWKFQCEMALTILMSGLDENSQFGVLLQSIHDSISSCLFLAWLLKNKARGAGFHEPLDTGLWSSENLKQRRRPDYHAFKQHYSAK
eukprot:4258722-Amphidinium_carterae.1